MPLYFAYGSNMGETALRSRCPKAARLCNARLQRHRFVLMGNSGYASVKRAPQGDVHGVLYNLALSDIGPLDLYEDIAGGLYTKAIQPVVRDGGQACQAMIYLGSDGTENGCPPDGYKAMVVDAARDAALPAPYVAMLDAIFAAASTPRSLP